MLKWVYKSGTFLQFTFYLVFMAVLWIPAFINPVSPVVTPDDGPLYELLLLLIKSSPSLSVAFALFLVVLQSVVLFYIYQANGFFGRSNFLPAIIVLLAYSWNTDYQTLHALLPAGLLCIVALNSLMKIYGKQGAFHQVFTAGVSLSLASLFYIPLFFMILLIWFAFISYRISTWREYAISIIGFVLPFLYYISWLYWTDNFVNGLVQYYNALVNLIRPPRIPILPTLWLAVSGFILFLTTVAVLNAMGDKLISLRRRAWVMFNFGFIAILAILLAGWPILSANYIFAIPMSFFITGSLVILKKSFWFEILSVGYFLFLVSMRIYLVM